MDYQIVFSIKLLFFSEALTHAVRSWEIFNPLRSRIRSRFRFFDRLLSCFECSAVWCTFFAILYFSFFEFWPFTALMIISRWANVLHIFFDFLDALRASTISKI
jgi:hypothetical protein